jgi:hypothetical protein
MLDLLEPEMPDRPPPRDDFYAEPWFADLDHLDEAIGMAIDDYARAGYDPEEIRRRLRQLVSWRVKCWRMQHRRHEELERRRQEGQR